MDRLTTDARALLLTGTVGAGKTSVADALGDLLTEAAVPTVHRRLARRHDNDEAGLRWHLARSGELHSILERARVEDAVVDAGTDSVRQVARSVQAAVGW